MFGAGWWWCTWHTNNSTYNSSSCVKRLGGVVAYFQNGPQNFGRFDKRKCGECVNGVSNPICFDTKCYRSTLLIVVLDRFWFSLIVLEILKGFQKLA